MSTFRTGRTGRTGRPTSATGRHTERMAMGSRQRDTMPMPELREDALRPSTASSRALTQRQRAKLERKLAQALGHDEPMARNGSSGVAHDRAHGGAVVE